MDRGLLLFATLLAVIILSGSLGMPARRGEIPFDAVRREFDAIAVVRVPDGAPSPAPLVVRMHIVGDAPHANIEQATQWLREHANVEIERDARGVPLYLTLEDLSATSGRSTLGATVATGMSAEVSNPRLSPCVVTHEILHFLGLKHVQARDNIMHPQCTRDKLDDATMTREQRAQIDALGSVVATTSRGVVEWAARADTG